MKTFQQSLGKVAKMQVFRDSQLFFEVNQAMNSFFTVDGKLLPVFKISVKEESNNIRVTLKCSNKTLSSWLKIESHQVSTHLANHLKRKELVDDSISIDLRVV